MFSFQGRLPLGRYQLLTSHQLALEALDFFIFLMLPSWLGET